MQQDFSGPASFFVPIQAATEENPQSPSTSSSSSPPCLSNGLHPSSPLRDSLPPFIKERLSHNRLQRSPPRRGEVVPPRSLKYPRPVPAAAARCFSPRSLQFSCPEGNLMEDPKENAADSEESRAFYVSMEATRPSSKLNGPSTSPLRESMPPQLRLRLEARRSALLRERLVLLACTGETQKDASDRSTTVNTLNSKDNSQRKDLKKRCSGATQHQSALSNKELGTEQQGQDEMHAAPVSYDWTSLPEEILWQIFSYLSVWELLQVQQTSYVWRRIAMDKYIGTTLDFSQFKGRLLDEHLLLILTKINAPKLKTLNFFGCSKVTTKAISKLPDFCPLLETLNLTGCLGVTNTTLYHLTTYPVDSINLGERDLDIKRQASIELKRQHRRPHRDAWTLNSLWMLQAQLNTLWIRGSSRPLPNIRVLKLNYCTHLSDQGLIHVVKNCVNLEEIYLGNCTRLSDKSCTALAASPAILSAVSLVNCFKITLRGLNHLFNGQGGLVSLGAPPCLGTVSLLRDGALFSDNMKLKRMETLYLSSGCLVLEECLVEVIPRKFPNLRVLDLSSANFGGGLSASGVGFMLEHLPKLRDLVLLACLGVRRDLVSRLKAQYGHINIHY